MAFMTMFIVHCMSISRLVRDVVCGRASAIITKECQEPEAEHIKGSNECSGHADRPVHPTSIWTRVCLPQNLVFRKKSGQRRKAGNRESSNRHGQERPRHVIPQAAHLAHVLFARHTMDDRTSDEKKQALEESMRHQMENAPGECPYAAGHEHVSELRYGGVGQHLL